MLCRSFAVNKKPSTVDEFATHPAPLTETQPSGALPQLAQRNRVFLILVLPPYSTPPPGFRSRSQLPAPNAHSPFCVITYRAFKVANFYIMCRWCKDTSAAKPAKFAVPSIDGCIFRSSGAMRGADREPQITSKLATLFRYAAWYPACRIDGLLSTHACHSSGSELCALSSVWFLKATRPSSMSSMAIDGLAWCKSELSFLFLVRSSHYTRFQYFLLPIRTPMTLGSSLDQTLYYPLIIPLKGRSEFPDFAVSRLWTTIWLSRGRLVRMANKPPCPSDPHGVRRRSDLGTNNHGSCWIWTVADHLKVHWQASVDSVDI